jgi:hypothetical protein
MAKLKKSLDKYDLGTPMIAGLLGGTADYGEGADAEQKALNDRAKVQSAANTRKRKLRGNRSATHMLS